MAYFQFLSTPSARRATSKSRPSIKPETFLSTPSARRATVALCNRNIGILISIHALREEGDTSAVTGTVIPSDFYPRPPRGGRLSHPSRFLFYRFISIHALREEGDHFVHHLHHHPADFYPRPPRGGRPIFARPAIMFVTFLSTPSARRATTLGGETTKADAISIHALREEGDSLRRGMRCGR